MLWSKQKLHVTYFAYSMCRGHSNLCFAVKRVSRGTAFPSYRKLVTEIETCFASWTVKIANCQQTCLDFDFCFNIRSLKSSVELNIALYIRTQYSPKHFNIFSYSLLIHEKNSKEIKAQPCIQKSLLDTGNSKHQLTRQTHCGFEQ